MMPQLQSKLYKVDLVVVGLVVDRTCWKASDPCYAIDKYLIKQMVQ